MKHNARLPVSWKLEEYAFGAVALREEIKRHKKEDWVPWNPIKAIWIRLLYIYMMMATFLLTTKLMLMQKKRDSRTQKKKAGKEGN